MEKLDIKILYKKRASFSSFFIHNLAQVLKPTISVSHKQVKEEPYHAFNIEIRYPGEDELFGELSAANLISEKAKEGPFGFVGKSLATDHWVSLITGHFREIAENAIFQNDRSNNDELKAIIKVRREGKLGSGEDKGLEEHNSGKE